MLFNGPDSVLDSGNIWLTLYDYAMQSHIVLMIITTARDLKSCMN